MKHPLQIPTLSLVSLLIAGTTLPLNAAPKPKAAQASASAPQGTPVRITSVEGITEYRLANGLRVLLFPDPGKPTITVNITYMVGSRHENYGETGMAHLLEHLMFKGSKHHTDFNLEATQQGAQNNATTWTDRTNYFEILNADDAKLAWALDMEADRMVNAFISQKDLWNPETKQGEMTVVRNEFEAGENSPFRVLLERVQSTGFLWHNYGKSTIGCRADIENVNEARLQAFYRHYYQPDNAVLLVAGRIDEAKTLKLIQEKFGRIPRPTRLLQPTYTAEPVQDGERQVVVRRAGDVQLAMAGYHIAPGSAPDFAPLEVLSVILGDTPNGRLHKGLVETRLATETFGWAEATKEPGYMLYGLQVPKEGKLGEAKEAFLKILEESASTPFTEVEVERAKTQLLTNVELSLNDATRVGLALSETIAQGDWRLYFLHRDRVKAITVEDVNRVAKTYLKASNRTLGLFHPTTTPDRTEVQPAADLTAVLKDYKGQAAVSQGEAFDPSPSAIAQRVQYSQAPSGLKLAIVPKKNRGQSVTFQFHFRMGDEKSLMGKAMAGDFAGQMLMRGTTKHTRSEISDFFDKAKARVWVGGGAEEFTAQGETNREHLPEVLRMVAEILQLPSFPASEFEQLKQQSISELEQARSEPRSIGSIAFQHALTPYPKGDVRYAGTFEEQLEDIKATTLEDVKAFHKTFAGASGGFLAVVGDVDAAETEMLVTQLFGAWKSPTPWIHRPPAFKGAKAGTITIETPDKPNASFSAGYLLTLKDSDPDFSAILLGNYMLGNAPNNRLWTRIREKEGLSYQVFSSLDAGQLSSFSIWFMRAILAPENAPRLEAALREELDRALKTGFSAEEVEAAKSGWFQDRQQRRGQDNDLGLLLTWNLPLDRPLSFEEDLDNQVKALTNEQIVTALRRYLDPSKLVIVKAGDFAGVARKATK
jgi:zinc protease